MTRSGFSAEGHDEGGKGNSEQPAQAEEQGARYDIGPGFEIAIRAALNKPLNLRVKEDERRPERLPPSADREHRHDSLEQRIDSVERALFVIVDQLKQIDAGLADISRRLPRA